MLNLAAEWKTLPAEGDFVSARQLSPLDQCRWLCTGWETDFLLLKPGPDRRFRLCGGALCEMLGG